MNSHRLLTPKGSLSPQKPQAWSEEDLKHFRLLRLHFHGTKTALESNQSSQKFQMYLVAPTIGSAALCTSELMILTLRAFMDIYGGGSLTRVEFCFGLVR